MEGEEASREAKEEDAGLAMLYGLLGISSDCF